MKKFKLSHCFGLQPIRPMARRKEKLLRTIVEKPYLVFDISPPLKELVRDKLVYVVRGSKWGPDGNNFEVTNQRSWAKPTSLGVAVNAGTEPWPHSPRRIERRVRNGRGK